MREENAVLNQAVCCLGYFRLLWLGHVYGARRRSTQSQGCVSMRREITYECTVAVHNRPQSAYGVHGYAVPYPEMVFVQHVARGAPMCSPWMRRDWTCYAA